MLAVLAYGAFIVFLLGLIPAFVICFRKERWMAISAGFLTFGLGWWVGAMRGESRRRLGNVAPALLCAALALGVVAARPVQFFGLGPGALQGSVGGIITDADECRKISSEDWSCKRRDGFDGGEYFYRVRVDDLGCWHGVAEVRDDPGPDRISGCVHLFP